MTAQHTKHAKHTKRKRRRRSPLRILIILILVIAVLVGLTLSTVHKKLGKISTKSLDHSQLVTVNKDSNMTDYTNYAFSELILRLEVCQIAETVLILS